MTKGLRCGIMTYDNDRPEYMYCRECGEPLDFLHSIGPIGLKSYPVWLGCRSCQTVYHFRKYSPLTKTGIYLTVMKDYTYDELVDQLSVGVTPKDPEKKRRTNVK